MFCPQAVLKTSSRHGKAKSAYDFEVTIPIVPETAQLDIILIRAGNVFSNTPVQEQPFECRLSESKGYSIPLGCDNANAETIFQEESIFKIPSSQIPESPVELESSDTE